MPEDTSRAQLAKEAVEAFRPVADTIADTIKNVMGDIRGGMASTFGAIKETFQEELGIVHDVAAAQLDSLKKLFQGPIAAAMAGVLGMGKTDQDEQIGLQKETLKVNQETQKEAKEAGSERQRQRGVFAKIFDEMRMLRRFFVDDFQDTQNEIKEAIEASTKTIEKSMGAEPEKKKNILDSIKSMTIAMLSLAVGAVGAVPAFLIGVVAGAVKEITLILKGIFGGILKPFITIAKMIRASKFGEKVAKALSLLTKGLARLLKPFILIGKFIAKNPIITRALALGKGFGKLLGKLFLPLTIIFSLVDGIKGFMQANEIFGGEATILQKLTAALSGIISGLTFGLLDTEKIAVFIDTVRQKFVKGIMFVFDGIFTIWQNIVDGTFKQQITDFMSGVWTKYFVDPLTNLFTTISDIFVKIKEWFEDKFGFVINLVKGGKEIVKGLGEKFQAGAEYTPSKETLKAREARKLGASGNMMPAFANQGMQPSVNLVQQNNNSAPTFLTQGYNSDDNMWESLFR